MCRQTTTICLEHYLKQVHGVRALLSNSNFSFTLSIFIAVLNYSAGGLAFGIILIIIVIAVIVAGVIFGIYWYRYGELIYS